MVVTLLPFLNESRNEMNSVGFLKQGTISMPGPWEHREGWLSRSSGLLQDGYTGQLGGGHDRDGEERSSFLEPEGRTRELMWDTTY